MSARNAIGDGSHRYFFLPGMDDEIASGQKAIVEEQPTA